MDFTVNNRINWSVINLFLERHYKPVCCYATSVKGCDLTVADHLIPKFE